jgi:hypothetical protein
VIIFSVIFRGGLLYLDSLRIHIIKDLRNDGAFFSIVCALLRPLKIVVADLVTRRITSHNRAGGKYFSIFTGIERRVNDRERRAKRE